ncbi:unnamed protein product, partial [Rotaria sp. Silwood2]
CHFEPDCFQLFVAISPSRIVSPGADRVLLTLGTPEYNNVWSPIDLVPES